MPAICSNAYLGAAYLGAGQSSLIFMTNPREPCKTSLFDGLCLLDYASFVRLAIWPATNVFWMTAEMKVQPHHADATAEEAALRR